MFKFYGAILCSLAIASCAAQRGSGASFGCTIDAAKVCEGIKDEPIRLGNYRADRQMLEQNAPATMPVELPLRLPNGDVGAELVCNMNSRTHKIIYSQVTVPPQTEQAAAYFKEHGLCLE
jgi:hypothetical protein